MSAMVSIHDLMRAVRAHPDYVFGAVFVKDDLPDGALWDENDGKWAEQHIVAAGFDFIAESTALTTESLRLWGAGDKEQ
jgi:hypothetical protein